MAATRIRLATYNVLAQVLAKSDYFPYAGNALKLKNRWPQLTRVLESLDADVICLSELDRVEEDYRPWLAARGYSLVYKRRGTKAYGNGIAFRTAKFTLVSAACADLNDLADAVAHGVPGTSSWHVVQGHHAAGDSTDTIAKRFRRDSVCVYAALRLVGHPERLGVVVGCTHTYWDPSMSVVRSAQAAAVLLGATEFAAAVGAQEAAAAHAAGSAGAPPWPVLIGGDFNSQPGTDSHRILIRTPLPLARSAAAAAAVAAAGALPGGAASALPVCAPSSLSSTSSSTSPAALVLSWDTLAAPPPQPPPRAAPAAAAAAAGAPPARAAASSVEGAVLGQALPSPPQAPPPPTLPAGRRAWLERLSAFVAQAVHDIATRHALPSADSSGSGVVDDGAVSASELQLQQGPQGEGGDPVLVSAYAAHARAHMTLTAVAPVDGAATTVRVTPCGLPRANMPLRHGAPAVALPLTLPLAAPTSSDTAGGGGGGGGSGGGGGGGDSSSGGETAGAGLHAVGLDGAGHPVIIALASPLPAAAALALDVLAEPAMTTMTAAFTEALDYLLFTPTISTTAGGGAVHVSVAGVLALPSVSDVVENGTVMAAPSQAHPSDHFPLVADIDVKVVR